MKILPFFFIAVTLIGQILHGRLLQGMTCIPAKQSGK